MSNFARRAASMPAYLALAGMLAACSGRHTTPAAPANLGAGGSAGSASGSSVSNATVYGGSLMNGATYVGPVSMKTVGLDVWVQMNNLDGLLNAAKAANDPSRRCSGIAYPEQIGAQYGANQTDYNRLVKYLNGYGIAVQTFPQRQMVRIRGPQAGVEWVGIRSASGRKARRPSSRPRTPRTFPRA